jgi:hypothetical protein
VKSGTRLSYATGNDIPLSIEHTQTRELYRSKEFREVIAQLGLFYNDEQRAVSLSHTVSTQSISSPS